MRNRSLWADQYIALGGSAVSRDGDEAVMKRTITDIIPTDQEGGGKFRAEL